MRTHLKSIASVIYFLLPAVLFAGNSQHSIKWLPVYEKKLSAETTFRTLNFEGASFDENFLPVYIVSENVASNVTAITAQLQNVVTEPLRDLNAIKDISVVPADFTVNPKIIYIKKKPSASVAITPIRKNAAGGYERLVSFTINIQSTSTAQPTIAKRTPAASSVLANGDWYKVGVLNTGIYKIDYNLLKAMGVDVDNIDPRDLRIFGNGGGVLPYANAKFRYDDLQLNNIEVSGESDGKFDPTDFIIFYGTNQTKWTYDSVSRQYNHVLNLYSDTTYYFITTTANSNFGAGRVQQRASLSNPTATVTSYDDYIYHEAEINNFLKSGREWYGEGMDNLNNSISFNTAVPNLTFTDTVFFRSNIAVRSINSASNNISVALNGAVIGSDNFGIVGSSPQDSYLIPKGINSKSFVSSPTLNVRITLTSPDPNVQGWLNYYEINFRRDLNAGSLGSQFSFRDSRTVSPTNITEFRVSNANGTYVYWDVTDPLHPVDQQFTTAGGTSSFSVPTDILRDFIAFNKSQYYTPVFKQLVPNQNLHALAQADMIIVTNPGFYAQARELADFHRSHDGLSVIVQSTQEIFNEFSSGAQDVSAIRDFVKMFYDRATVNDFPRFVCLMGDASYDNKFRIQSNTNFVTSYQSAGSINQTLTYMSDDFFGLLDNNEGNFDTNDIVDLAVGRLPVKSVGEAQAAVKKIIKYVQGSGTSTSNPTMGSWRNTVTFVGDDQDHDTHFKQADTLANRVKNGYPLYNIDKIYLDSYNQESTPGGDRYPDAHNSIVNRVERGSLLLSYIGHGGELGWAHERVLEVSDINNWTNSDKLAGFLTATCEFTRVDDPSRTSAGELVFLNPTGGGICLFTTSRLAFSTSNFNLCTKFFTHVFDDTAGVFPTTGEVFERTKRDYYQDPYVRNFILIGDPAVKLAYPKYKVKTKTINGVDITLPTDTLKALSKITITGEVQDNAGSLMTNFNGTIYPTVYDKMMTYFTLGNDFSSTDISTSQPFLLQKNVVYSGKASVSNGLFTFSFVVPKDIAFQYGHGKLSYYAQNGQIDAAGYDSTVLIGGINYNASQDGEGPKIQLYINDEKFVRGGMTDKNPFLYAIIKDSSGVNTVGTGIGHDMSAELDGKSEKKYILNDYYENDLDSYQAGKVRYPFKNLASGPHTLTFKVWDVFNNSSEASTDFVVSESAELALDHVLNYPNPFTTHTTFMFEHNKPFITMDVQVQIYTVSGKLIKTISDRITPEGYRSDRMQWDGLDDYGDKIGKGVYVYRLRVQTADGQYADKFEKLVILR